MLSARGSGRQIFVMASGGRWGKRARRIGMGDRSPLPIRRRASGMPGSRGLTLLELLLSLAALTMILQGFYLWKSAALEEARVQRTVDGFVLIDEAAYAYHVEQSAWPTSLADLRDPSAPLLALPVAGVDPLVNGVGRPYRLSAISGDRGIRVTTQLQTHEQAVRVQRAFPHRTLPVSTGSANVVFEQRAAPKDSSDHDMLVWRDGSREMKANLDFDGFGIDDANSVEFRGSVVGGRPCAGKRIATSSAGALMECVNRRWRAVRAASEVECMWTGWQIVSVVSWGQSGPGVVPVTRARGSVIAWWCDAGTVTHVRAASCRGSRVSPGFGLPAFHVSGCSALANPP